MKKASFLSLLMAMCLFTPCAYSEQAWVNNVSEDHGWLDYEKNPGEGDGDDNLCWAASASCIIDYWQGLYVTSSSIPSGSAIWERFKEVSADQGGNQVYAIQWWLGGDYGGKTLEDNETDTTNDRAAYREYSTNLPIQTDLNTFSGYYWDAIPDTYPGSITTSPQAAHMQDFIWCDYGWLDGFSTALINRISSAPIGLGLMDTKEVLGHAITLWGVEYENDTISKVWITDSDDDTHTIRELETGSVTTTIGDITGTFITLKDYSSNEKYGDVCIVQSYGINVAESDTWGLLRIPEPTTSTLTLLSLIFLANRRKRNR